MHSIWRKCISIGQNQLGVRNFAKVKKGLLLQDESKIPVTKYKISNPSDRRVYVWGLAETGALGVQKSQKKHSERQTAFVQHPTRLQFAEANEVVDVTCGYGFSAFLVKQDEKISLYGTGINTDCQIGYHKNPGITNKPLELLIYPAIIELPKIRQDEDIRIKLIAAGRAHLVALSETGTVFALGNNFYGQCGRDIIKDEDYVTSHLINRFNVNNEMITNVFCGQDHTILLTNSGKLFAFGWGADGQIGSGNYETTGIPTLVGGDILGETIIKVACSADCVLALNENGNVFGWGNSEYGQFQCVGEDSQQIHTPRRLNCTKKLGKIVDIAAGGSFCMVLNEHGDVFVWGYGILGLGAQVEQISQPTKIPSTLFGQNEFNKNTKVTSIYSGINHMGAITNDGDLYMWGLNRFGCLGLGHIKDMYFPFKAAVGAKVEKISCGVDHTMAICKPFV